MGHLTDTTINKSLNVILRRVISDDAYSRSLVFNWNIKLETCEFLRLIVKFAFAPSALTFCSIMLKGYTIEPRSRPFLQARRPPPQAKLLYHVYFFFKCP